MPYSEKHNLLFIHIPKCAGKSFEVATGIITEQEVKKYKWRSTANRAGKYVLKKTLDVKAKPRLWGVYDMTIALQHLTYAEIELLNLLDKKFLDSAIKVAIIRNPYDRAVSSYHHMGKDFPSFLNFLQNYFLAKNRDHNALAHKRSQIDYLRNIKGKIVVDNILKFENLNKDFEKFKLKYGFNFCDMPHFGRQKRDKTYKKYYCNKSKELVESIFEEDIKAFEYEF